MRNPIIRAMLRNPSDLENLKVVLENYPSLIEAANEYEYDWDTPFLFACLHGYLPAAKLLTQYRANKDAKNRYHADAIETVILRSQNYQAKKWLCFAAFSKLF